MPETGGLTEAKKSKTQAVDVKCEPMFETEAVGWTKWRISFQPAAFKRPGYSKINKMKVKIAFKQRLLIEWCSWDDGNKPKTISSYGCHPITPADVYFRRWHGFLTKKHVFVTFFWVLHNSSKMLYAIISIGNKACKKISCHTSFYIRKSSNSTTIIFQHWNLLF